MVIAVLFPLSCSHADDVTNIMFQVLMTSLVVEKVQYSEKDNMWIGPREEDLIHVGAKYSPCMRADENMNRILDQYDEDIKQTACCVRNDGAGCFQSNEMECPVSSCVSSL